ncbi:hypothetical protein K439DRAFT_1618672 [Ramaria rubella]|nr:hypothetical protein K439DRAFT_1618672 [Ramaria rubella]
MNLPLPLLSHSVARLPLLAFRMLIQASYSAFCARTDNKAHVWFTSALVKAWAHVLACKATVVTFDKPPDTPLFAFYYKAAPGVTVQPPGDDGPSWVSGNTGTEAIVPTTTQGTSFPPTAIAPDMGNMLLVCLGQMQMQML